MRHQADGSSRHQGFRCLALLRYASRCLRASCESVSNRGRYFALAAEVEVHQIAVVGIVLKDQGLVDVDAAVYVLAARPPGVVSVVPLPFLDALSEEERLQHTVCRVAEHFPGSGFMLRPLVFQGLNLSSPFSNSVL